MSHLDAVVIGEGTEKNKNAGPKNTFFRILRRVQIGVLIIGTLLFLAWCCSYFIHEPQTESPSYANAEQLIALDDCCGIGDKAEHKEIVESGMLPGNVVPHHYNLTLQLFMFPKYNFTTKGNVQIFIECKKETKLIVLHARDLIVESATVTPADETIESNSSYSTNVSTDVEKQQVLIQLDETLKPQSKYILEIPFQGIINNISVGLYRSSYLSENGSVSWIASTQFEPSDARRVFPCFDEPALKATIQFTLICQKDAVALSNMPSSSTEQIDDEWKLITFMETPRMSTYTFAFVSGEIGSYTDEKVKGIQIWSRNDMVQYGELAQNITPVLLNYLEEYIEVPFTMPKLDLAAVPIFLHAAMENWGLIIFEESALLYDPEKSSTENKVFVTLVIGHELAHQWFGNLVTASWWDNIWLNEGFATYYEYIAVDRLQPRWNIMHVFIATIYEVMETDSMVSTRAMGSPVHADEVLASFDEISYLKGGAIVRMLQHFIGAEGFRIGLKNYLWRYSHKSATEFDLWQNLNLWNRNKHGIKQVMTTWTRQSGYPVVKFERDYDNRTVLLTQKPFTIHLDDTEESTKTEDERIWSIPITFTHGSELDWSTKTDFWLTNKSDIIKDLPDENTWFLANVQQVGYYRVNYDSDNWNLIMEQLVINHTDINVINRAQILNDILNLARSDDVEYALALNMTKYLFLEEEYLPWQAALTAFKYLDIMLAKTPGHDEFKEYLLAIMTPLYENLGWSSEVDKEDITKMFLRKNILKWSCSYDHPGCVKKALAMFQNWKQETSDNQTLSADDREIVLCTGIARGPTEDWEFMWKRYLGTNFKAEKNILLKSLACTRETRLLRRLLKRVMDKNSAIPPQDGSDVFVYVAENFYGRDIVYDFFKRHMEEISFKFGSFAFAAGNIVDRVTASLNTDNEIEELQSILKGRKTSIKEINKSLKLALHRSQSNVKWMKNNYDDVFSWLQENKEL